MGNVLFLEHMSTQRDAALHDLWSPVASTAEARVAPARAAAYRRVTEKRGFDRGQPTSDAGRRHQA